MEVKKNELGSQGEFIAQNEDEKMGKMTFSISENRWIIDHTEVYANYRGQGVGEKLLEALVNWARKEKKEVLPLCPFAAAVFQKREDIRDVLKNNDGK